MTQAKKTQDGCAAGGRRQRTLSTVVDMAAAGGCCGLSLVLAGSESGSGLVWSGLGLGLGLGLGRWEVSQALCDSCNCSVMELSGWWGKFLLWL